LFFRWVLIFIKDKDGNALPSSEGAKYGGRHWALFELLDGVNSVNKCG